jgi:CheY-like chemotaxis protein
MQRSHPDTGLVLIAERDLQVRRLQQHFLTDSGYAVAFADDGESALERARAELPALVVTEILIPKLDGLALCRRLREDPLTRDVPVLVFSILSAQVRASEAGADAFLRKPLVDSTFLAAVQELIAAANTRAEVEQ